MTIVGGVVGLLVVVALSLALVIKMDGFLSGDHVRIFRYFRKSERAARHRQRGRDSRVRAKRQHGRSADR